MRLILLSCGAALLLFGCPLRPRYADFVSGKTEEGKEVAFLVTDADTGQPVPNAQIELGEQRGRVTASTDVDGIFKVPFDKKYVDGNPVFVITLPKGVIHYRLSRPTAPEASPDAGPKD